MSQLLVAMAAMAGAVIATGCAGRTQPRSTVAVATSTGSPKTDPNRRLDANAFPPPIIRKKESGYGSPEEFAKALASADEAIRRHPTDGTGFYERGLVYHQNGDHDKAIVDYTEAIRLRARK